jgi:RND family efflux transporter MFP subunit
MGARIRGAMAVLGLLGGGGCHRVESTPLPPPLVSISQVQVRPEPPLARRGAVSTGARLRLGFNTAGVVAKITVKTGDVVHEGQTLARLKDGGASASLRIAEANRSRAARDFGAANKLAETGSVPELARKDAHSSLQVASANASLAAETMSDRRIVSPISGTVLQRLAEAGEVVGPGAPVLVIDDTDRLVVKVGVNERELARVKINQSAKLVLDGKGGAASMPAVVTSIGPAPLEDGLYPVEVSPTSATNLHQGTLLTVEFDEPARKPAMVVPLDALVHRDQKTWAFVLAPSPKETRAKIREVALGHVEGKDVVVLSGLNDGERIIREGAYFLRDGQVVRLLD